MAAMLKQLSEGGGGGGDGGGDEDFSKLLLGMMEELTNKEILYEPMKELDDRFPKWMEDNKGKVAADDLKRYEEQRVIVRDIVAKYDQKDYSDSNKADREYIVDKMQQVCCGSPPTEVCRDLRLTTLIDASSGRTASRPSGRHVLSLGIAQHGRRLQPAVETPRVEPQH